MPDGIGWKNLILPLLFSLLVVLLLFSLTYFDQRTKIIFCDVGQGDAAYIRIKNKTDILIDAGPNQKVLECLGKYMPFYDRTIEYAILSHPQIDHFGGFINVLDHYQIKSFYTTPLVSQSKSFTTLNNQLQQHRIKVHFLTAHDHLIIQKDIVTIFWPKKELISNQITEEEMNDFSLILSFQENDFTALFTGDASPFALNGLEEQPVSHVSVLKIPHHGSKYGLTKNFLQLANPQVGVISVGKNNSYGHPTKEILDMLKASKTKILRTDEKGDIVFKLK